MIMVSNIFDGVGPRFGGARLPNDQSAFQGSMTNATLGYDRKRRARRAACLAFATFARHLFLTAENLAPTASQPWSQRLGGQSALACHILALVVSAVGRLSALLEPRPTNEPALMTITKIFVTYFKHPIVSL